MNWAEMVVAIVALATIGGVLKARYQARGNADAATPNADTQRAQEEVRQLKERIQVLERVITDNHGSHDLEREIDRLRDR